MSNFIIWKSEFYYVNVTFSYSVLIINKNNKTFVFKLMVYPFPSNNTKEVLLQKGKEDFCAIESTQI